MATAPKITLLRSTNPLNTGTFYKRGFVEAGVELVDVPFDPTDPDRSIEIPPSDLAVIVDCGRPALIPALKDYKGKKGFISIDSCHKLDAHKAYVGEYAFDHIWVAQKHVVSEFTGLGEASWLPLAADELTHAYRPEMAVKRGFFEKLLGRSHYDIGMCAAPYDHRRRFESVFKDGGLSTNFHYRSKFGSQATYETSLCTIGFNLGAGYTGEKGLDLNMRVFETMAGGLAMLLTNTYEGLGYEELFEDGVHYVTYSGESDALEKAAYYASRPLEASRIAREGARLILKEHTYRSRCEEILKAL